MMFRFFSVLLGYLFVAGMLHAADFISLASVLQDGGGGGAAQNLKVTAEFDSADYQPGVKATLTVTVKEGENPKSGVTVSATITKSESNLDKTDQITNSEGKAVFEVTTAKDPGDLIVLITAPNSVPITPAAKIHAYQKNLGSSRVRADFIVGTTIHHDYDADGKSQGFDATSEFAEVNYDQMWVRDKSLLHLGVSVRLSSFPKSTDLMETNGDDGSGGSHIQKADSDTDFQFTDYDDSVAGTIYFDYEPNKWRTRSPTNQDKDNPYDYLRFGIRTMADFISRQKLADNQDAIINNFGAGITFKYYKSSENDKKNVWPHGFLSATYNRFEEYGDMDPEWRWLITGIMRLDAIGGSDGWPFHLGVHVNAGKGSDDIRIFAGFRFGLDRVVSFLN